LEPTPIKSGLLYQLSYRPAGEERLYSSSKLAARAVED
jgi:hypothetical protein